MCRLDGDGVFLMQISYETARRVDGTGKRIARTPAVLNLLKNFLDLQTVKVSAPLKNLPDLHCPVHEQAVFSPDCVIGGVVHEIVGLENAARDCVPDPRLEPQPVGDGQLVGFRHLVDAEDAPHRVHQCGGSPYRLPRLHGVLDPERPLLAHVVRQDHTASGFPADLAYAGDEVLCRRRLGGDVGMTEGLQRVKHQQPQAVEVLQLPDQVGEKRGFDEAAPVLDHQWSGSAVVRHRDHEEFPLGAAQDGLSMKRLDAAVDCVLPVLRAEDHSRAVFDHASAKRELLMHPLIPARHLQGKVEAEE